MLSLWSVVSLLQKFILQKYAYGILVTSLKKTLKAERCTPDCNRTVCISVGHGFAYFVHLYAHFLHCFSLGLYQTANTQKNVTNKICTSSSHGTYNFSSIAASFLWQHVSGGGHRFRVACKVQHISQNAAQPRNFSADLSTSNFGEIRQ